MRITLIMVLGVSILVAGAAEAPLAKAVRLREEGNVASRGKRWEEAVGKFEEALRLFEEAGESHLSDRVELLRAICWSLTNAEKHEECRAAWIRLATLAAGNGGFEAAVASGYAAVATSSEKQAKIEAQIAFLTPVREAAVRLKHAKTAAQVLHDMAFYRSKKGQHALAVPLLETAVSERQKIRDLTGLAWSHNNLADDLVKLGRRIDALPHLKEAFSLVHRMDVRGPQASIAIGVRAAIKAAAGEAKPSREMRKFLWAIAFVSAEAAPPAERMIPVDSLFRAAISADPDLRNLGRIGRLEIDGVPAEVRADIRITAARAYLEVRRASNALRLLDKLETGDGPAKPYLAARLATAQALAVGAKKKKRDFREAVGRATAAWHAVDEVVARRAAFADLVAAVRKLEMESEFLDLVAEQKRMARGGEPGGLGTVAMSEGNRSGFGDLGPRDPLFEFTMKDGKILITDLVTKASHLVEIRWQPHGVSLNGVSIWTYGGYVKIVTLAYGGAAVSSGTPAMIPLTDLLEYHPVPGKGRAVLQKNGAVRYE